GNKRWCRLGVTPSISVPGLYAAWLLIDIRHARYSRLFPHWCKGCFGHVCGSVRAQAHLHAHLSSSRTRALRWRYRQTEYAMLRSSTSSMALIYCSTSGTTWDRSSDVMAGSMGGPSPIRLSRLPTQHATPPPRRTHPFT